MEKRFILENESDLFTFLEDNKHRVNEVIYDSLAEAITNGKEAAVLFSVGFKNLSEDLDIIFELPQDEYKSALTKCLSLFEEIEDYDKCIGCRDFINTL